MYKMSGLVDLNQSEGTLAADSIASPDIIYTRSCPSPELTSIFDYPPPAPKHAHTPRPPLQSPTPSRHQTMERRPTTGTLPGQSHSLQFCCRSLQFWCGRLDVAHSVEPTSDILNHSLRRISLSHYFAFTAL